jgi:hypothetical protein
MPQPVRALRATTATESSIRSPNTEPTASERRFGRGTIGPCDERVD